MTAKKHVVAKLKILMMANAKEAFSIAQVLLEVTPKGEKLMLGEVTTTVFPFPVATPPPVETPPVTLTQSYPVIARRKYTPAIRAPTMHRSTKATNGAFLRTESILNNVANAHTAAIVATINKTRM